MSADWLKDDVGTFLQDFGEDIVVVEGNTTRPIKAIVDRPAAAQGTGQTLTNGMKVEIANHPTKGIDAATMVLGKFKLRVPVRPGSATTKDWFAAIPADDPNWIDEGMMTLLLQ